MITVIIVLIKQEHPSGCLIACLCMFLNYCGKSFKYIDLLEYFNTQEYNIDGITLEREIEVAAIFDLKLVQTNKMYYDSPAILSVDSLNRGDKLHAVFWDGQHCFDPSTNKCYEHGELPEFYYATVREEDLYSG